MPRCFLNSIRGYKDGLFWDTDEGKLVMFSVYCYVNIVHPPHPHDLF